MNPTRDFVAETFTPREQLYLRFASISIKKQMRNDIFPVCLRTDEVATVRFLNFLEKFYQDHKIVDLNYHIKDTFSRVYTVVTNELITHTKTNVILFKSTESETMLKMTQVAGFLLYASEVRIPVSPRSPEQYLCFIGIHNTDILKEKKQPSSINNFKNHKKVRNQVKAIKNKENVCMCGECNKKIHTLVDQFFNDLESHDQELIKLKINVLDK